MKSAIERALYILGSRDKPCKLNKCQGCEVERKEAIDILTAALTVESNLVFKCPGHSDGVHVSDGMGGCMGRDCPYEFEGPNLTTRAVAIEPIKRYAAVALVDDTQTQLKKEAERYRKLRAMSWHDSPICVVRNPRNSVKLGYDCPSGDRLDELIDELP